jgi:hypothetical protein
MIGLYLEEEQHGLKHWEYMDGIYVEYLNGISYIRSVVKEEERKVQK